MSIGPGCYTPPPTWELNARIRVLWVRKQRTLTAYGSKNVRCFLDAEIPFDERVTVIVGGNASG
jgi:hypothetical protein